MKRLALILTHFFILSFSHSFIFASWDELATLARGLANRSFLLDKNAHIQASIYTAAVFFDYNNDGQLDLLMMGQGGDWNFSGNEKYLHLYRNLGPEADYDLRLVSETGIPQRRDEAYFNPITVGDVDHDGYTDIVLMTHDPSTSSGQVSSRHIDYYHNDGGTGHFTLAQSFEHPATNGAVTLGDVDGDGWLDLFFTGYSDFSAREARLYRNAGWTSALTFHDTTPSKIAGAWQGQSTMADIDGDGRLDLLSTGTGDDWACVASLYLNRTADGDAWAFDYKDELATGLKGASRGNALVADFNADGRMDIIIGGETKSGTPQDGFRTRIYYQREDGSFNLDTRYPVMPVNQDGGINMGDVDGDGNMDLVLGGWIGSHEDGINYYATPLRVFYNEPLPETANTFPTAPEEITVVADESGETLTISWTPGSDTETRPEALRYNLFMRNDDTGETWCLIPADTETGRLRVGTDLQTSLSSLTTNYTLRHFGAGHYTIGVSTLDQSSAPSPFATTTLTIADTDGIDRRVINASDSSEWFSISGQRIAKPANHGIYISGCHKLLIR